MKADSVRKSPMSSADRKYLADQIKSAGDSEVLSAATISAEGKWIDLRVMARGKTDQVPVVLRGLRPGDILMHNHPSGELDPSVADLDVASVCAKSGIGFAIHDNSCRKFFVVVEPFKKEESVLLDASEIIELLSGKGKIAAEFEHYEERSGQIELARAVVKALNGSNHAILEGETGVGKSIAYLVPAVCYARKNKCRVVVSTNTINLQHQLCAKDLPLLQNALDFEFSFCLVKGRRNYICLRRLNDIRNSVGGEILLEKRELEQFGDLCAWAQKTRFGDLTDLSWIPFDDLWEKVCSEKESCAGIKCRYNNSCFLYRARRQAAEADILVVNHHLLFSDLALRATVNEYSQTAVIPSYKAAILDEAHNIEEIATRHFGCKTTAFGLQKTLGRIYSKRGKHEKGILAYILGLLAGGKSPVPDKTAQSVAENIREKLIPMKNELSDNARDVFEKITHIVLPESKPFLGEHRKRIKDGFFQNTEFQTVVKSALAFCAGLKSYCRELGRLKSIIADLIDSSGDECPELETPFCELSGCIVRLVEVLFSMQLFFDLESEKRSDFVHFFAVNVKKSACWPSIHSAPVNIAEMMISKCFNPIECVILTSATLSTCRNFSFIKSRIGLDNQSMEKQPIEGMFESPFDFDAQTDLLVPTDLPEPSSPDFMEKTIDHVFQIVQTSSGGAMVLCTSYMHLQILHERLHQRLAALGIEALRQGEMERHHLIEKFRQDGNAVLFATDSFWEGVDIPGSALRTLIIAKLPFAIPDDPILEARQEELQKQGKNPFRDYQLPIAAIKLKQGFGRLIRNVHDRGVIWILDNRILTKFYGGYFLESLPPAPRFSGGIDDLLVRARRFFADNY